MTTIIRGIVFDLDGTLARTEKLEALSHARARRACERVALATMCA